MSPCTSTGLREKGLAMVSNPLDEAVKRTVRLPLYYAGLTSGARCGSGRRVEDVPLNRAYEITAGGDARGVTWLVIE